MTDNAHKEYYHHIHLMRGFAIAWVVGMHAMWFTHHLATKQGQGFPVTGEIINAIFHNSTIYFALISGLLYGLVLHKKPIGQFYRSKLTNVVVPYLVVSAFYLMIQASPLALHNGPTNLGELGLRYVLGVTRGDTISVLWYIPVVLSLFALTPVAAFILQSKVGPWFLYLAVIAPLFSGRGDLYFGWENVVYFGGPYVLGIWLGTDYGERTDFLKRMNWVLLSCVLGTSTWQILGQLEPAIAPPTEIKTQLYYIQKLSLGLLILLVFKSCEGVRNTWLE